MILIDNKYNCCGCTACASICSHMAIKMNPDSLGFLYPQVNSELCVGCGLCDKVCQFYEGYKRYNNYETPMAYQFRLSHD